MEKGVRGKAGTDEQNIDGLDVGCALHDGRGSISVIWLRNVSYRGRDCGQNSNDGVVKQH